MKRPSSCRLRLAEILLKGGGPDLKRCSWSSVYSGEAARTRRSRGQILVIEGNPDICYDLEMCGISGLILKKNETVEERRLELMVSAMALRGPDSQGMYLNKNYGLGHRRLKVIDISDSANQPMKSRDGKIILVFNGEIYNYQEFRKTLEDEHQVEFSTQSDTEVILNGYEVYGTDVFARLNGMFAFAILDRRTSVPCLFMVRDRFGIKPLFYSEANGRLAFASEVKPLMKVDWISKEIDQDALFYFLKFSHVPCPKSIFSSVKQLEPGTFIKFEEGTSEVHTYYDQKDATIAAGPTPHSEIKTESQWLSELESTLKSVLKRQLVSDVPIGAFLSGGVDSSLLTLLGSEVAGKPLQTFTISYGEKEFDESSFAREVADRAQSKHHEIHVNPQDTINLFRDAPKFFDQPFADPTLLPSLILARETRKEVTVALSGDGADELFFGYPYQKALMSLRHFKKLPLGLRKASLAVASGPATLLNQNRKNQWLKLKDILQFRNESELLQYFIGTIGPVHLDRLERQLLNYSRQECEPWPKLRASIKDFSWRQKVEQTFLRTFMMDTVLTKTDRSGMAFGLEARVPFLDDEMVSFACQLPSQLKYQGNQSKYLLRKLLEKKMPGKFAYRKKKGFSIPLRDWLKNDLKLLLNESLNEPRLKKEGIFNAKEVMLIRDEYESGKANHSHLLFSMMMFQQWKDHYGI